MIFLKTSKYFMWDYLLILNYLILVINWFFAHLRHDPLQTYLDFLFHLSHNLSIKTDMIKEPMLNEDIEYMKTIAYMNEKTNWRVRKQRLSVTRKIEVLD